MSRFCVIRVAMVSAAIFLWAGCGDTYRPVVIPNVPNPPNPKGSHAAFVISDNGAANPGSGMQIDVSGDTDVGITFVGRGPTHATVPPGGARVVVANAVENTVTAFTPGNATSSIGTPVSISLPSGSNPAFVNSAEDSAVYVANVGNDSVSAINLVSSVVIATVALPAGSRPVALVETPDAQKVYVANQGTNSVASVNVVDKSLNPIITDSTIASPVWVEARGDSQRVYVLSSGNGDIAAIDTVTDTLVSPGATVSAGAGANFMVYDNRLDRLYVTNPTAGTLTILNAGVDPPSVLGVVDLTAGTNAACAGGCTALAVAILPDGSQAYVTAFQATGSTTRGTVTAVNTRNNLPTKNIALPSAAVLAGCAGNRFRVSTTASADSSRVYVASCDAGNVSVISSASNSLLVNLPAPVSAATPSTLTISAASQSGSSTTYSYVLTSGAALQAGLSVAITGMADTGNNGSFTISSLGAQTFTVVNPAGVTASGQNGSGVAARLQNPIFIVPGP